MCGTDYMISIHALFAEGDWRTAARTMAATYFYPRPLRRGRRVSGLSARPGRQISIHALFAEGDVGQVGGDQDAAISIHALFAEGDQGENLHMVKIHNFYPRPLRRGRRKDIISSGINAGFLSTPSSQRATCLRQAAAQHIAISIHALFAEGDRRSKTARSTTTYFYPRPLRRGRPPTNRSTISPSTFLSTPSSQRATASRVCCQAAEL